MDDPNNQVRFHITLRPAEDGRVDVLLKLYSEGQLSSETVVSTVEETKARMILLMARMQLFRLRYEEYVPVMPRATAYTRRHSALDRYLKTRARDGRGRPRWEVNPVG